MYLYSNRVVITSGNLTVGDWTVWSNCLWFKDFPKISLMKEKPVKKQVSQGEFDFDQDFTDGLKVFTQALIPIKASYKSILDIDIDEYFISDIDIVLIPSIPGRHTGEDLSKYGHTRVRSVLDKIGYHKSQSLSTKKYTLSYQTSSIGNLDEKFLGEILSSFLPNYRSVEDLKAAKKPRGKNQAKLSFAKAKSNSLPEEAASERVRLIFPTKEYVESCIEGPEWSGCLILGPDVYARPTFPKDIFYQYEGTEDYAFHEGVIPHLKVYVVTEENKEIDDDGYIYFGSHNFSPSAWGRYEKEYTQLSISNTELGVLFPPAKGKVPLRQI